MRSMTDEGYSSSRNSLLAATKERALRVIRSFLFVTFTAYVISALLLVFAQQSLLYRPDPADMEHERARLPGVERLILKTQDGESLVAWHRPPRDGRVLFLYFHGNGGNLGNRAGRFMALMQNGDGLLALSYRGYGGSTGAPTEAGLLSDANAAYEAALAKGYLPGNIIVIGESLGTGVAVALAARRAIGGLALEAPFSSAVDVARVLYWMFPVDLLMRDQFRSDLRIADVKAPLLIMHGDSDGVVPIAFGEKLFELAREPKEFVRVANAAHLMLAEPHVLARFFDWVGKRQ